MSGGARAGGAMHWKQAIVVGASSGIGEAMARRLARAGVAVALVARRGDRLRAICDELNGGRTAPVARAYVHDVRAWEEVPALFQRVAADLNGVDLVVYSAGIMPPVPLDAYPTAEDVRTLETNLVGAVAWLNEAAHRFAVMGEGTIIGISSVAGDRGRAGHPVYNASKAALDTYLEALRARLRRHGVIVLTAKPGPVRTPLIEGLQRARPLAASPDLVAAQILAAAVARKRVIYTPRWWRPIMLAVRAIPRPLFERLRL